MRHPPASCHRLPLVIVSEWLGGTLGDQVLNLLETDICHFIPGKDHLLFKYCPERLSVVAQMWYEVPHVCDHSYETGQLLLVYGGGGSFQLFPVSS